MLYNSDFKFIFVRIPKTASTSTNKWFLNNFKFTRTFHCKIHSSIQECHDNNVFIMINNKLEDYEIIANIRDPLDRALSAYFFIFQNFPHSPKHFRSIFKDGKFIATAEVENQLADTIFNKPQTDYLTINGKNIGTFWLYERLTEYQKLFLSKHNLIERRPIGNDHSEYRPKEPDQINMYFDEKTKRELLEFHKKDYELYMNLKETKYT